MHQAGGQGIARVTVFGSVNMDHVVTVPRLPSPGETVIGDSFQLTPGGKGANQAVAAARLGATVAMVGRVGRDANGDALLEALRGDGVGCDGVSRDDDAPSGAALIVVDEHGQNTVTVAPGANFRISERDAERAVADLDPGDILLMQLEVPVEVVERAAVAAAAVEAVTVVLNAAPFTEMPDTLLKAVDVLVVNETEAAAISGDAVSDPAGAAAVARSLVDRGIACVIITLGDRGAVVAAETGSRAVPARQVEAVDATAAGDAFAGALVTSLAAGYSLDDAVERAGAAAAAATTRGGAQASLPTPQRLRELFDLDWSAPAGAVRDTVG